MNQIKKTVFYGYLYINQNSMGTIMSEVNAQKN